MLFGARFRARLSRAETGRPADLVEGQFVADAPNQLWVNDITDIRTFAG